MRRSLPALVCIGLLTFSARASMQSVALRVVTAGPSGELNQLSEANEIRVVFSEPMVPLGRIPSNPSPGWIHITPAIPGSYRWSGTTMLIFTPDPATPVPASTAYNVTIDARTSSDAGHSLGTPYEFSFTTPTVKLTSLRWYRRNDRFDQPVVLVLQFNQRMRPADVLAHTTVRYQAHDWEHPIVTAEERARMGALEPAGLRQYRREDRGRAPPRADGPTSCRCA